jgi:hypothetical protein
MRAFLVDVDNRPGSFATIAELIAGRGVNILSVSAAVCGVAGRAAIITNDEFTTRSALTDGGITFIEREIIEVAMRHEPGSLAAACRRLAEAGVNLEALIPVGMEGRQIEFGFVTDDAVRTRELLEPAGLVFG